MMKMEKSSESMFNTDARAEDSKVPAKEIGCEFVRHYYTMLSEKPNEAGRFYSHESYFMHNDMPEVCGIESIQKAIQQLNFQDCKARIYSISGTNTVNNGLVLQVCGELALKGSAKRRFCQTFILHPQSAENFYVHDDVFQWLDKAFGDPIPQQKELPAVAKIETKVQETGQKSWAKMVSSGTAGKPVSQNASYQNATQQPLAPPRQSHPPPSNKPSNVLPDNRRRDDRRHRQSSNRDCIVSATNMSNVSEFSSSDSSTPSGASLVPILSPEEVGEMFNLDAKVVEWIKNEPADDKDPLLVLDFKDAFFNHGNYDANKAAVTNALVASGATHVEGSVFKFANLNALYAARKQMLNNMLSAFYSSNGAVVFYNGFPVNQQQTIHTTVITSFSEQTGKLTINPYQFFKY